MGLALGPETDGNSWTAGFRQGWLSLYDFVGEDPLAARMAVRHYYKTFGFIPGCHRVLAVGLDCDDICIPGRFP